MWFQVGEKKYKAEFSYFNDCETYAQCTLWELVGETGKEVATKRLYCNKIEKKSLLRKKLLAKIIKELCPPSMKVEWTKDHINIPKKITALGENLVQKYVAYKLEQMKLTSPQMRRSYEDAVKRWGYWSAIHAVHPATVPYVSDPHGKV